MKVRLGQFPPLVWLRELNLHSTLFILNYFQETLVKILAGFDNKIEAS